MKLLITVLIPSQSFLRDDIKSWDKYGAGEALDNEMTLFESSVFATPNAGIIAESVSKKGYKWSVQIVPNLNYYPVIKFYDVDKGANVATITGAPKEKGVVKTVIQNLLNRVGGGQHTNKHWGKQATIKKSRAGAAGCCFIANRKN